MPPEPATLSGIIGSMTHSSAFRTHRAQRPALLLCTLLATALLSACSSGGGDGSGGTTSGNGTGNGTTTGGATTGATTGGATAGGTGGGTGGGTTGGGAGSADLSQAGTLLPRLNINTVGAELVSNTGRARAEALSDNLGVIYEVTENQGNESSFNCAQLGAAFASCSVTNLHIKDATGALTGTDWRLYFHSIRRILRADSDKFDVYQVNGDLNYLAPSDNFQGFDGSVESVRLITEFQHLIESDFMPRYWFVQGLSDGNPRVTLAANTDQNTDESTYSVPITGDNARSFSSEIVPLATPATRFAANADTSARAASLTPSDIQSRIVPRPTSLTSGTGSLDISSGVSFNTGTLPAASVAALAARQSTFMSSADGTPVSTSIDGTLDAEAYTLNISNTGISIVGGDEAGVFYGAQSVLALVQPGVGSIPNVTVNDAPRFAFRGMHVDVARNFHSVDTLKRVIDQMAAYKLNKLHIHLTDDEGWRLQIPSLPELTSVGGQRQFQLDSNGNVFEGNALMPQLGSGPASNNAGSGFYTRADFIEILEYATARFIDVIPAIDMPAHARAAVVSMRARAANLGSPLSTDIRIDDPEDTSRYRTIQHYDDGILNPCIAGTYTFIETVVNEVSAMYQEAGAELDVWHMGGDEANNVFKGFGFGPSGVTFDPSAWDFPWEGSPACATYIQNTAGVNSREDLQPHFVERVSQIVSDAGIPAMYAYQDIYDDRNANTLATTRAGVGFWEVVHQNSNYNNAAGFANRGFETVIAVPDFLYFDFPQEVDPEERGYYWATRFTDTRKVFAFAPENLPQNAETSVTNNGGTWTATGTASNPDYIGMQGQLWGETVRTPAQVDYMAFPRLLALAERAWHRADWELDYAAGTTFSASTNLVSDELLANDWASFAAALGTKELAKLDAAGVQYRIPVPGASTATGTLEMNVAYPGLPLEAGTGNALSSWIPGMSAAGVTTVRARSANSNRTGRIDTIE